jgi:hypothetical protein
MIAGVTMFCGESARGKIARATSSCAAPMADSRVLVEIVYAGGS